jgi:hypothetical protein
VAVAAQVPQAYVRRCQDAGSRCPAWDWMGLDEAAALLVLIARGSPAKLEAAAPFAGALWRLRLARGALASVVGS